MVAHWPSRLGAKDASEFKRIAVGEQMRRIADSVLKADPGTRIVAMGDFNDDPTDPSMAEGLGARTRMKELEPGDFYNPFGDMLRAGMKQSSVIFDKMVQIKYQTFIDAVFGDSAMYGSGGKKGGIPRMQCV